jgi:predicted metal-dependent hydrolase
MNISINGNNIKVIVVRKSIKNMYFRIDENSNLLITVNKWVSDNEIKKIINEKKAVILKMYNHKIKELDSNAYFIYLGEKYNVIYEEKAKQVYFSGNEVYTKDDKMLDKFYISKCLEIFQNRVNLKKINFSNLPNFSLRLRKMKTRWGVCNIKDKVITLNTELLKKDMSLIDYVIVHEISHLYHPNHSKSFWNLVSTHYPYYKVARKMLKEV